MYNNKKTYIESTVSGITYLYTGEKFNFYLYRKNKKIVNYYNE